LCHGTRAMWQSKGGRWTVGCSLSWLDERMSKGPTRLSERLTVTSEPVAWSVACATSAVNVFAISLSSPLTITLPTPTTPSFTADVLYQESKPDNLDLDLDLFIPHYHRHHKHKHIAAEAGLLGVSNGKQVASEMVRLKSYLSSRASVSGLSAVEDLDIGSDDAEPDHPFGVTGHDVRAAKRASTTARTSMHTRLNAATTAHARTRTAQRFVAHVTSRPSTLSNPNSNSNSNSNPNPNLNFSPRANSPRHLSWWRGGRPRGARTSAPKAGAWRHPAHSLLWRRLQSYVALHVGRTTC
jgi:hypothetical protein